MYRGAGILFAWLDGGTGRWEVLLGERTRGSRAEELLAALGCPCGAGYWSVPGGGLDPSDGSLRECALRECLEECWNDTLTIGPPIEQRFREELAGVLGGASEVLILDTPHVQGWPGIMEYHTFLVRLARRPDEKVWPRANHEYTSAGFAWRPVTALPERLHYCAARTIEHFRQGELRDVNP